MFTRSCPLLTGVCSGRCEVFTPALCSVELASAKSSRGAEKQQEGGASGWKQVWLLIAAAGELRWDGAGGHPQPLEHRGGGPRQMETRLHGSFPGKETA